MKEYPINEIFYSLQGEGHHTGRPSVNGDTVMTLKVY